MNEILKGISETDELLSPKLDIIFKMLFGTEQNKDKLIYLLKSIVNELDDEIDNINLLNPFTVKEYKEQKQGIMDIRVGMKSGGLINVEIQVICSAEMAKRILFYWSEMYSEPIKSGDDYGVLKKTISIVITDFNIVNDTDDYYNTFWLYNPNNGVKFTDMIEIHTLELKKLPEISDNTDRYRWMKFIGANRKEEFEMVAQENTAIKSAYKELQRLSMDDKNRQMYKDRIKVLRDENSRLKSARNEGVREGKIEMSINLFNLGISIDKIAKAAQLDVSEVEKIIKN